MRTVTVELVLETDRLPVGELAEQLDIHPFSTRSEFPPPSIAKPYWMTEIVSDWLDLEAPLLELRDRLAPKMDVLEALIRDYGISAAVILIIRADWEDRPVMAVPPHLYPFLERLHAELIIDVAYEW